MFDEFSFFLYLPYRLFRTKLTPAGA